ncbi:MAG TPA: metallophosphoesterase [Thermodesulfobacteriota bacterium]|nr:metallophosphoesterase [Thermodesulfobacteriota bacterium]
MATKERSLLTIIGVLFLVLAITGLASAFDKVRFAVISDPHMSIPQQKGVRDGSKLGLKSVMLAQNAIAEINQIPDLKFVLVAGDLTQDAEPWNVDEVRRILDQLKVPYFVVLGNHDSSLVPHEKKEQPVTLSKYTVASAFIGRSGGMEPGMTYYSHTVAKDLVLVALDSTRAQVFVPEFNLNDFGGEIDAGQKRWLERTLKANQNKTIIILIHHSLVPWADGEKTNDHYWRWCWMDNAEEVRALLKKYGVKIVFSGHHHISTRYQTVDDIYHFINPAINVYPMRYTVYEITPRELSWQVKSVPASNEVWELAKKNILACQGCRRPEHPDTAEGNEKYLEFLESPGTMKGKITYR